MTQIKDLQYRTNGVSGVDRIIVASGGATVAVDNPVITGNLTVNNLTVNGSMSGNTGIVTGTANEVTVTYTGANPKISLPSALTFTGKTVTGGTFSSIASANFGSVVAPGGATDLSKHIALYGTFYGFSITASSFNHVAGAGAVHNWYTSTTNTMTLGPTGNLTIPGTFTGTGSGLTSLNATNLASGTVPDARLPARLGLAALTITDWNNALDNGWYMGASTSNSPDGTAQWFLGTVEAHGSSGWRTQTVHAFTVDGASNTYTWRRAQNNGTWEAWYKLQLSQTEQDARYAAVAHSHTFASLTSKPTTIAGYGITDLATSVAAFAVGSVGSYALCNRTTSGALAPGDTIAGSELKYINVYGDATGNVPTGTWRTMGQIVVGGTNIQQKTTLFLRIA